MDFLDFKKNFFDQLIDEDFDSLDEQTNIKQLSSWDSLTAMAVITMISDEYGVKIEDKEIRNVSTLGELFALAQSKS